MPPPEPTSGAILSSCDYWILARILAYSFMLSNANGKMNMRATQDPNQRILREPDKMYMNVVYPLLTTFHKKNLSF